MDGEHIEVTGIVQGVGFRPFVHRLASALGLVGSVGNDPTKVFIEVAGAGIDEFVRRLVDEAPPLAKVESVTRSPSVVVSDVFRIVESRSGAGERTLVPPDSAVCDDCLAELFDPNDRRHRHPFITCTNCGPRFTIITGLPYDRPNTTMAEFAMCAACESEYTDPSDRRFHAQPIACPACGPRLRYTGGDDPIRDAARDLAEGAIVAIKGLGGFHLACDASSDEAIERLRDRKHRPDKPFAVMSPDIELAAELGVVDDSAGLLLRSPARPIVLVEQRPGTGLSELVAPGNPMIGLLLPYTPIHHLLLDAFGWPLVMTSANASGAPILHRAADEHLLDGFADQVLTHDRPIHVPCDDSVVRVLGDRLLPIRRARGYAPVPVPVLLGAPVIAAGAELKNTACVASGDHAWVSQHVGDMENLETLEAFERTVDLFMAMYDVTPDVVAADAHPGYLSGRWARENHADRLVEVQHHHAHVAALMAEHALDPDSRILGFAFDGTGYGDDGTIWGGEVLDADARGYDRVAHLAPVPLPGGDAAIRHPSRVALAHLWAADITWSEDLPPVAAHTDEELRLAARQFETGFGTIPTTSMGRLFDAIASLLGLRHDISYEAQAAIDLEIAATKGRVLPAPHFAGVEGVIDPAPFIVWLVAALREGARVEDLARTFHEEVARVVETVAARQGAGLVGLTGGVFQNALLTERCVDRLERSGVEVLTHRLVPPNDGGLALGQAFVAAARRGDRPAP